MGRLTYLVATLALYFGVRFLSQRWSGSTIRLRDGRRVKLLSSVALLDGSTGDLLALEYFSARPHGAPAELQQEALDLVETIGVRAQYATCRAAVVAVRRQEGGKTGPASPEITFTFRRSDSGADWYPSDGLR